MFIAINMGALEDGGRDLTHTLGAEYVRAIREAGAVPLLIPAGAGEAELQTLMARADAVIFSGGPDYPPEFYGAEPHPETRVMVRVRAESDLRLAQRVLRETRRPVLGICGGLQLVNIALGGRLIQHVERPTVHRAEGDETALHPIRTLAGTRLRSLLGAEELTVNSFHHQAADPATVPPALRVAAVAEDGTVEALEGVDDSRFLMLVQWHPEAMPDADHRARIFGALVAAARDGGRRPERQPRKRRR